MDEEKRAARRRGSIRIRQSKDELRKATRLAQELIADGRSPYEQHEKVSQVLADPELADKILQYEQRRAEKRSAPRNVEKFTGLYVAVLGAVLAFLIGVTVRWLYRWVVATPSEVLPAVGAACGQAVLLRMAWTILKAAGIALTDSLNLATYPTRFHQPDVTSRDDDERRYDRLRILLAETVACRMGGQALRALYAELTEVELTTTAAAWLLFQAEVGVFIKSNLPPYSPRTKAYAIAAAASIGCTIGLCLVREHLNAASQEAYLVSWAILFVAEFLRRPKRVESREPA